MGQLNSIDAYLNGRYDLSPYEALGVAIVRKAIDGDPEWIRSSDGRQWLGILGLDQQAVEREAKRGGNGRIA